MGRGGEWGRGLRDGATGQSPPAPWLPFGKGRADRGVSGAGGRLDRRPGLKRGVRWAVALLLAGIAAWLSVRQVEWAAVGQALARADGRLLAVALATVLFTTAAKAARWLVLLRGSQARIGAGRALRVLLIGQMGNSFLPARLGDVGRAVLAGRETRGGTAAALGTIVVEKALDGLMGLGVVGGLALWTPLPGWVRRPALGLGAVTAGLLVVLLLAATRRGWATARSRRLLRWLPAGVRAQVGRAVAGLALGLGSLRRPGAALAALALSGAVWGLAALTNVVTLAALGIEAPGWSPWLVLVAGYAVNLLPTLPAQVGVFEYACIVALAAAGVGPEAGLALGLVLHVVVYGPPAVLGPVSMAMEGVGWKGLRKARARQQEYDGLAA
jgi:uncharacterized membrane protein YbhN (UPF0104 family)